MARLRHRATAIWVLVAIVGDSAIAAGASQEEPMPPRSSIRIARSADGLTFQPTGELFLRNAAGPDLTLLPNGRLIALFDYWGDTVPVAGKDVAPTLARSESVDNGRTWSPAQSVIIQETGRGTSKIKPRHARLIVHGDHRVSLIFVVTPGSTASQARRSRPVSIIRMAGGRTIRELKLQSQPNLRFDGAADLLPSVARWKDRLFLYAAVAGSVDPRLHTDHVHQAVAGTDRVFVRAGGIRVQDTRFFGSMLATPTGLRVYATGKGDICSLHSTDGRNWLREPGPRLAAGRDPAVVQLRDGSYLMLYVSDSVDTPSEPSSLVSMAQWIDSLGAFDASSSPDDNAEPITLQTPGDTVKPSNGAGEIDAETLDSFAPQPNFESPVDYLKWYNDLSPPVADNAFETYRSCIPELGNEAQESITGPEFRNLIADRDSVGPPSPWHSHEHPEWEQSYQATGERVSKFAEACTHLGFAMPPIGEEELLTTLPGGKRLLLGVPIRHVEPHRRLAEATLAGAWRVEDGRVSGERMLKAWETVLRGAAHLEQRPTLIEHLVAATERNRVRESARSALQQGVIPDDQLESALRTLRTLDPPSGDLAQFVLGEHAFVMDVAQYLFGPPDPDGTPRPNLERARAMGREALYREDALDAIADMNADDVREALDSLDAFYQEAGRQMRIGYPDVRATDLDATLDHHRHANPLTEHFLPSLSRYHALQARNEASRRATQLAYETHLFKVRNGRWPQTLEELPASPGSEARTDPFTGLDFGYRLSDDGPTIYSRSENGLDDGGVHAPRWNDAPVPRSDTDSAPGAGSVPLSDDFVFWPPPLPRP